MKQLLIIWILHMVTNKYCSGNYVMIYPNFRTYEEVNFAPVLFPATPILFLMPIRHEVKFTPENFEITPKSSGLLHKVHKMNELTNDNENYNHHIVHNDCDWFIKDYQDFYHDEEDFDFNDDFSEEEYLNDNNATSSDFFIGKSYSDYVDEIEDKYHLYYIMDDMVDDNHFIIDFIQLLDI